MKNPALTHWLTQPDGIATRLGAMRRRAGRTGQRLADDLGWSASKVSRVENGRVMPTAEDIRAWSLACGLEAEADELIEALGEAAGRALRWQDRLARGAASVDAAYDQLLAQSTDVAMVEVAMVPGPLQTVDYAEALFTELAAINPIDELPRARAERRARRHDHVYDDTKRFEFVITENVLRTGPATPEVMAAQLDRLMTVLALGNVDLRVLPARPGITVAVNSFAVYDRELVLVETFVDENEHHADANSATYLRVLERLRAAAASGDTARQLILEALRDHRTLVRPTPSTA